MPTPHPPDPKRPVSPRSPRNASAQPRPGQDEEIELQIMELEERIAPKLAANHNECLLME